MKTGNSKRRAILLGVGALALISCPASSLFAEGHDSAFKDRYLQLQNVRALLVDFEVSEGIYSRACIEDTDLVCLWLGANVMLEYSCEEATDLLQKNLENARANCCLSGERDCKFCVLMKKTLRYLAGVAGPSGYGSNSTAEQVTQQDCSFLLPSSQAQLTALVTG
ncbi:unnamed protein product [Camellia sinensis]